MSRPYFSLLQFEPDLDGPGSWGVQFGDYDRQTVEDELDDYAHSGIKRKNLRIIRTGDKQADIEAKVAEINRLVAAHAEAKAAAEKASAANTFEPWSDEDIAKAADFIGGLAAVQDMEPEDAAEFFGLSAARAVAQWARDGRPDDEMKDKFRRYLALAEAAYKAKGGKA